MANISSLSVLPTTQGNVTVETAFPSVSGGSVRGIINAPTGISSTQFQGRVLRLRCAAVVTGGTTTNYTLKVYWYNSVNTDLTTFTGDIGLFTSGALAFNTVTGVLLLQSDLYWDATSAKLDGAFSISNSGTNRAYTGFAANTQATGVVASVNLKFFATGIFSATNAANAAILSDFSVDLL